MQVYRGLDIGTAKPDPEFLSHLPHHLIDIRDPNEQFGVGDFVRLADLACADIWARGKFPVVLGGTAFYLRNFIYGLPVTPEANPDVRRHLLDRLASEGAGVLMAELAAVDPESARRIHIHDEYRIVRALEVYIASGRPLSSFRVSESSRPGYRFLVIALERDRQDLRARIDRRVVEMFDEGLPGEFERLIAKGYTSNDPGMQAIGYREFFSAGTPVEDLAAVRALIQNDSRKYAKRQETFIHALPCVQYFGAEDFTGIATVMSSFMEDYGG